MVSYKNLFLIKGLTCWNWLTSTIYRTTSYITSTYKGIRNWFHPDSSSWYLYPNTLFPVSYSNYYSLGTSSWKYRPDTRELTYLPKDNMGDNDANKTTYRIPWLTARTSCSDKTKDMDDFLDELRIHTTSEQETVPSMVLLQAWSLHDKQWWSAAVEPRLEWFDTVANEHSATWSNVPPIQIVPVRHLPALPKN